LFEVVERGAAETGLQLLAGCGVETEDFAVRATAGRLANQKFTG
jgi:hypothetical protein